MWVNADGNTRHNCASQTRNFRRHVEREPACATQRHIEATHTDAVAVDTLFVDVLESVTVEAAFALILDEARCRFKKYVLFKVTTF
jgi:hypothetical protein